MTLNPILALELRSRWRMDRSYLLLLGVVLALSALAGYIYQSASYNTLSLSGFASAGSEPSRAGTLGRELFVALSHVNILVWLLIAAASAATGIARERERGLLESLQLSRIRAGRQIGARFGAQLLLLGALQLVLLPIYAVALLIGGVSPLEVAQAFVLVAQAAVVGTTLGLWFSARAYRPTNALFGALGVIAAVSGGLWFFIEQGGALLFWPQWFIPLSLLHPSVMFEALRSPLFPWPVEPLHAMAASGAFWLVACGALGWSAVRNVARTLPPPRWQSNAVWVDWLRARQVAAPPKSRVSQRASGALLTDLPLDRFVRFSDPLLAREVKSRFRLRRAGFWVGLIRFALFLVAASIWIFEVFSFFDSSSRLIMVPAMLRVFLWGGALCLGVLAATSWTRERESGAWESLKLSLLPPRQILRAKWLSPLISFAYYTAPLWILLPIGLLYVDLDAFALGVCIVMAWLGLTVALGLWMSWRIKNGTAAIATTIGILALLLVGWPVLNAFSDVGTELIQWRYGVTGTQDRVLFAAYDGLSGYLNDDIADHYLAATGRQVPKPLQWPPRSVAGQLDYSSPQPPVTPEWFEFQKWGENQMASAEAFKVQLGAWNPSQIVDEMFDTDKRPQAVQTFGNAVQPAPPIEGWKIALWNTLSPLALTLVLLGLLRRDVRREQLNA